MREAEKFRYLMLAAQREGNRQLAVALEPHGLTPAQSEVLRILGDNAPMTLTELGRMLVCDSGTNPSRLVDKLVGAGLVQRAPDAEDRRQVVLSLTVQGQIAERSVATIEDELYSELDAALGTELAALIATLEALTRGSAGGRALAKRIASRPQ
jgi:MarR family transcriptional regulator, organic hydroperoxide resistance regulator